MFKNENRFLKEELDDECFHQNFPKAIRIIIKKFNYIHYNKIKILKLKEKKE